MSVSVSVFVSVSVSVSVFASEMYNASTTTKLLVSRPSSVLPLKVKTVHVVTTYTVCMCV